MSLRPDHDAATLRDLMNRFAEVTTAPTRQELTESLAAVTAAPGVAEGDEMGTFAALKGWQQWNVLIRNNFYNGRYPDYSARLYGVVASSPEEARQVVLDNADYVLKDLLSKKTPNGKRWLPPKSAVPIEDKRVGSTDTVQPGSLTTMGFKTMLTPEGPKSMKFNNGQIVDIQGEESSVAEGVTEAGRRQPGRPKFTAYPNYAAWRQELMRRGDDQIDHLDNDYVDNYRVLFAVDRNRRVVGMYYRTADTGTFVPPGQGFGDMIYYASTDPHWPYSEDDGKEDLR